MAEVALRKLLFLAAFLAAPAAGQEPPATPAPPADYASEANWLCLPGRADDPCGAPLPTATLNAENYGPVGRHEPAADPPIDCFYVYPTISRDAGMNSDLEPGVEEQAVAAVQFARFTSLCRPFAPVYRQATLASLRAMVAGANMGYVAARA